MGKLDTKAKAKLKTLAENRDETALFLDIDGTLAEISPDPSKVTLAEQTRELVAELASQYLTVVCVSGRRSSFAHELVNLSSVTYVGNHGLERQAAGSTEVIMAPQAAAGIDQVQDFVDAQSGPELDELGIKVEDKGPVQVFHWRQSGQQKAAETKLNGIAKTATEKGLVPKWGRKVLEIRPPVAISKGTAVADEIRIAGATYAFYAGDDLTDIDAFRAITDLAAKDELKAAVCVAVLSDEGPEELHRFADIEVGGPRDLVQVLETLTG